MYLKAEYTKALADHITVSIEDLNTTELALINKSFTIFQDRLADLKAQQDEVKRLSIELANLQAMKNDSDERSINDNYLKHSICPTCGRDETFRNEF